MRDLCRHSLDNVHVCSVGFVSWVLRERVFVCVYVCLCVTSRVLPAQRLGRDGHCPILPAQGLGRMLGQSRCQCVCVLMCVLCVETNDHKQRLNKLT